MALLPTSKYQLLNWYFDQLKLYPSPDPDLFLNSLTEKHGEKTVDELIRILELRSMGLGHELYAYKNQTLALSIDFAQYSADLYMKYLEWFISVKWPMPKRILDIGCDNGIVTCFYALLFPDSEIVGMDISTNAIRSAVQLAKQFNLTNIQFITGDVINAHTQSFEEHFDLIISLRSAGEIFSSFPDYPAWTLKNLDPIFQEFCGVSTIQQLLKRKQSIFITCERLGTIDQMAFWANVLHQNGLFVHWDKSSKFVFHELGQTQEMPVFVADCTKTEMDFRFESEMETEKQIREGIYSLYIKDAPTPLVNGQDYEGPLAEVIFSTIANKEFLTGLQVTDGDDEQAWYELWQTPNMILKYQYTNEGHRELRGFPHSSSNFAQKSLEMTVVINQDKKVIRYKNLNERTYHRP